VKKFELLVATALTAGLAVPAAAQDGVAQADDLATGANAPIIVTAQRQSQTIQEVPIAVSVFGAEALESQQIESVSDLQLSLPNITFSKGNFTGSSLAIRGVGNLCVGFSCDSALGVHINGMPLLSTNFFETEYYDLQRIEVLRGPQGTLFGRNATSGVINTITAPPDLSDFSANVQLEYGNYDSMRAEGMVNLPLADWAGIRIAGMYLNRDGYTRNLFTGNNIDGRDLYSFRGSLRLEPTPDTTLDIVGYYFRENDNRSRIQKQLCHRDPTGVLGCLPDYLTNEQLNANATLASIFASQEFLEIAIAPGFSTFGLSSLYGPDTYSGIVVPADVRTVNIDFEPTYFADEWFVQARLEHDFGPVSLSVTGGWQERSIDTRSDYNLTAAPPFDATAQSGINSLFFFGGLPGGFGTNFGPVAAALFPNGPTGPGCTSEANLTYAGVFGGDVYGCSRSSIEFDRSTSTSRQWSIEGILTSDLDGPFNFLIGGIYLDHRNRGDYFVNAFGLDYAAGIIGAGASLVAGGLLPPSYVGPSSFNSETSRFTLESYGLFGEVYVDITDNLRLTGGIRYSNDSKSVSARSPLLATLIPIGTTDVSGFIDTAIDADVNTPGQQAYRVETASFSEVTGRVVLDWQWSPDNLIYASWSRGYKSGGINPPVNQVEFPNIQNTFSPEIINAFEIGSKNTIGGGALQLNASAFFYDYGGLQLSRIVARTSINTNTDAIVYGLELEAIVAPHPNWLFNMNASVLESRIGDLQLIDSRDPSGGRSDVVIIKSLDNASNCAVIPQSAGNAAGSNAFVNTINGVFGLPGAVPIPGTTTTGAFAFCSALSAAAGGNIGAFNPALAALQPLLDSFGGFTVAEGAEVDITGNTLPQAPNWKFSIGGQYTHDFSNGMDAVFRLDYAFTGGQFSRGFNRAIDRIPAYGIANAQVQLNGNDDRWFVRAFVQNIFNNNAVTGQYVTDPSSGLFTNIFTLEPRRYGIAAGFNF
jgi:outer membrane receptor protein involved in Fe transport